MLWALATERKQDRIASSSTDVSNAPLLTGKWKKMGDCPPKQVQIQEFKYEYLRFSAYSSYTRFEILSGERLISLYSLLMSEYFQTVDVVSTSLFHATKKRLASARTQLFKIIAHIRAFGARMSMPLLNHFLVHPKTLTVS